MSAKKSRSNKKQIHILVDFMAAHSNLATGEFTGPLGAKKAEPQWQALKNILTEHGPDRSIEQWKQTWKDLKKGARAENAAAAKALSRTGNTQPVPDVSEIAVKVLSIIRHEYSTGNGHEESIIGEPDEKFAARVQGDNSIEQVIPPPSYEDLNIHPANLFTSQLSIPSTSNPPHPTQAKKEHPHLSSSLQEDSNITLQSLDQSLKEHNNLLREQNSLMREQNAHLAYRNKIKRRKRFAPRFF